MNLIRGATWVIESTIYLNSDTLTLADLTGATIKASFKTNDRDLDNVAVLSKSTVGGIVISSPATNGICLTTITAAESNVLMSNKLYFEIVVKLANGTIIRSGIDIINIQGNVLKTLF